MKKILFYLAFIFIAYALSAIFHVSAITVALLLCAAVIVAAVIDKRLGKK